MEKIMSEEELIHLIRDNLTAWAMEESQGNKDSFINRYEETVETFLEALQEKM